MIEKLRAAVERVASNLRECVVYDFNVGTENTVRRIVLESLLALEIALEKDVEAPATKATRFVIVAPVAGYLEGPSGQAFVEVYVLGDRMTQGKIGAIKVVREEDGLSLLEAKNLVESLPRVTVTHSIAPAVVPPPAPSFRV